MRVVADEVYWSAEDEEIGVGVAGGGGADEHGGGEAVGCVGAWTFMREWQEVWEEVVAMDGSGNGRVRRRPLRVALIMRFGVESAAL